MIDVDQGSLFCGAFQQFPGMYEGRQILSQDTTTNLEHSIMSSKGEAYSVSEDNPSIA